MAFVLVAVLASLGAMLVGVALVRLSQRSRMRTRLAAFDLESPSVTMHAASAPGPRELIRGLGARLGEAWPTQLSRLSRQIELAGLGGRISGVELLGWRLLGTALGVLVGLGALARFGVYGLPMLAVTVLVGWFTVDLVLGRQHAMRCRAILRDLPTVMDLLVLSLEAGMGLDRAMRTVIQEYRSPVADEFRRVLADLDLGLGRGEAFERMAARVTLEDVQALSRAIVQSQELGVSLVGVMQTQAREVRISRRRAAEAEALRAPIKMLVPLVVFILPTLFMLLLGPVGLRTAGALSGAP